MSKISKDPRDLIIDNLKKQVDEYKSKLQSQSYDSLTARITELESNLETKAQECEDLKATANLGEDGGNSNELKTKLILFQSKIRATESKLEEVTKQKEELEQHIKREDTKSGNNEQVNVLKTQLKQEMERNDKLRTQLNQQQSGNSPQAQEEINNLKRQIQALQSAPKSGGLTPMAGATSNSQDVNRLKSDLTAKDQRIAELEKQLTSGANINLSGPMANVRLQREINALKSQIDMLKKNEGELKRRYEEVVRKAEAKGEEDW